MSVKDITVSSTSKALKALRREATRILKAKKRKSTKQKEPRK